MFDSNARALFARFDARPFRGLFATFGSLGMRDFIVNWVAQVESRSLAPFVVGAVDAASSVAFSALGFPTISFGSNAMNSSGYFRADERAYLKLAELKMDLLHGLLSAGWDVLISDADVLWFDSPWPWLGGVGVSSPPVAAKMVLADVLISSDAVDLNTDTETKRWLQDEELNTGIVFLRSTPSSLALVKLWKARLAIEGAIPGIYINEQAVFNRMVKGWLAAVPMRLPPSSPAPDADDDAIRGVYHVSSDIMREAGLNITMGSLPLLHFASGHVYFVQLLPQRLGITPCAVHTTFQFGDTPEFGFGKRQRMRSAGAWHLDNSTYFGHSGPNTPGGRGMNFLALEGGTLEPLLTDPPFSPAVLSVWAGRDSRGAPGANTGIPLHFVAESVQRERLRDALALARSLNRALILPRLSCYCDRHYWLTRACRHPDVPGFSLPIADCPLDHVHEPDRWERAGLDFRAAVRVAFSCFGYIFLLSLVTLFD